MQKLIILLLCLIATKLTIAQQQVAYNFSFNHMAFSVKDLEASVKFYKIVFQLREIENRSAKEGIRWFSLGEDKELHLIAYVGEPVQINKAVHLAVSTLQLDAFVAHLQQLKLPYSDWTGKPGTVSQRADGVKQIYLQDPNGYWIEINNGYTATPGVEQIKNEIWQLEMDYWKYVKEKDMQSYRRLWDENFIGYPSTNNIGGKANITDWITEMYSVKNRKFDYELTRKIENVFGDIVIVLYDATQIWTSDKGELLEKVTFKLTHTWKRTAMGWLIIGGMGAKK